MFGPKGRSLNIQQFPLGFGAVSYVNLKLDNLSNQQKAILSREYISPPNGKGISSSQLPFGFVSF